MPGIEIPRRGTEGTAGGAGVFDASAYQKYLREQGQKEGPLTPAPENWREGDPTLDEMKERGAFDETNIAGREAFEKTAQRPSPEAVWVAEQQAEINEVAEPLQGLIDDPKITDVNAAVYGELSGKFADASPDERTALVASLGEVRRKLENKANLSSTGSAQYGHFDKRTVDAIGAIDEILKEVILPAKSTETLSDDEVIMGGGMETIAQKEALESAPTQPEMTAVTPESLPSIAELTQEITELAHDPRVNVYDAVYGALAGYSDKPGFTDSLRGLRSQIAEASNRRGTGKQEFGAFDQRMVDALQAIDEFEQDIQAAA